MPSPGGGCASHAVTGPPTTPLYSFCRHVRTHLPCRVLVALPSELARAGAGAARMRYRARLMYDGLAYAGSQFQDNAPSIAGELQAALAKRTQQDVRVVAAGRTDTGVHARGQAIHFDVVGERFGDDPEAFQRAVNSMLPHDVRLDHLETVGAISLPRPC